MFEPKPGGHNAIYCSKSCKSRIRYKTLKDRLSAQEKANLRRKSYWATRSNPNRYEKHKESNRRSVAKVRKWLADYKLKIGCVDCGYKGHFAALQLDHEGEKTVPIAHARSSIARLLEEIERGRCVVRCANCHAVKTWERKQKQKGLNQPELPFL